MKKMLFTALILFTGCASIQQTTKKVQTFTKCYIHKLPAPFWVCYQSSFISVGKIKALKKDRLKQEEAYSRGISDLILKLQRKTKLLLRKLDINNKYILNNVKNYVIINAIHNNIWFDKKNNMLYVEASIEKNDFEKFLQNKLKVKNNKFSEKFNETF